MATSVEPTTDVESSGDDATLSGLEAAFGGLADALIDDTDQHTDSLEADLTDEETVGSATDDAAEPEPVEAAEEAAPAEEPDPLATAKPFEYTVDGHPKTYDGIKVLTDASGAVTGGIIPADALKDVQYRLQRQEYLETQNQSLYQKVREFDGVAFTAADGRAYAGLPAVQQMEAEHARLTAAVKVLAETLENPDKLIPLALAVHEGNNAEIQRLSREVSLAAKEASLTAKERWEQRSREVQTQASSAQERSDVTRQAITASVQHWASQFPTLTQDDVQRATQHFEKLGPAVVRPATPDEAVRAGVKPGELVIDHQVIHEWLQDRAEMRSQQQAAQATATKKAQDAAAENARRLAAAARGKSGQKPSPGARAATKPRPATSDDSTEETWQQQKDRLARGEFTRMDDE